MSARARHNTRDGGRTLLEPRDLAQARVHDLRDPAVLPREELYEFDLGGVSVSAGAGAAGGRRTEANISFTSFMRASLAARVPLVRRITSDERYCDAGTASSSDAKPANADHPRSLG